MQLDDLSRVWKSQPEGLPADLEEVLVNVKKRSRAFDRKIFIRDVSEGLAGILLAGIALRTALLAPGWSPKAGALVLTAACAWIYWRLHKTRRAHPAPSEDRNVAARLQAEIAKVDAQAELLRSVGSWYIKPLAIGGMIWLASLVPSIGLPLGASLVAGALSVLAAAGIFTVVGWGVVRLNRHAVEAKLEPYRQELVDLLGRLENA